MAARKVMNFKKKKNRGTKTKIIFDDEARTNYLKGFSKRKQERKQRAKEAIEKRIKEEEKRLKEKYRDKMKKYRENSAVEIPELEEIFESKKLDFTNHTVTVTEVKDISDLDQQGIRLGTNKVEESDSEEGSGSDSEKASKTAEKIKLKDAKVSKGGKLLFKSKHKKSSHKNFAHSMDKKHKVKKKQIENRTAKRLKKQR